MPDEDKCVDKNCMVSIIIPVHNEEAYILEALRSIFKDNADFTDHEVLLVDDNSTDQTVSLALKYFGKDKRLHLIGSNGHGVSNARNTALSKAHGKYIIFCDADDRLAKGAIEALVHRAEETNADLVIGRMKNFSPFGSSMVKAADTLASTEGTIDSVNPMIYRTMMITAKLYRTDMIVEHSIQFLPISYSEDAAFYMNCVFAANTIVGCNNGKGSKVPIIYEYRKRAFWETQSVTQIFSDDLWNDFMLSNNYVESLIQSHVPDNIQNDYLEGYRQRTCENIVRAFWKYYWLCSAATKEKMVCTLQSYRKKIDNRKWDDAVCPNPEDGYLGLVSDHALQPFYREGKTIHYGVAVFINYESSSKQLNWVLNSLYRQSFPSFCVIIHEKNYKLLATPYRYMENIYVLSAEYKGESDLLRYICTKKGESVATEYILPMNQPLGIHGDSLSRMVRQMIQEPDLKVIFANTRSSSLTKVTYRFRNRIRKHLPKQLLKISHPKFLSNGYLGYADSLWRYSDYRTSFPGVGSTTKIRQSSNAIFIINNEIHEEI